MSKELQALIIKIDESHWETEREKREIRYCIDKIKEREQRLEAIDNANPNEAFEETGLLRGFNKAELKNDKNVNKSLDIIQQALFKAQEQEKVLKVIWNRKVDLWRLRFSKTLKDYNTYIMKTGGFTLTQEEFDTLKRWSNEQETNTN